jgi:methylated-DNA-protein-cysteine methyltransferase-like protein
MSAGGGADVPWHRVVNVEGRISAAERRPSSDLQRALLEAEGVVFDECGRIDLAVFRWEPRPDLTDRATRD